MFTVKSRDVFVPSPKEGVGTVASCFAASAGGDLLSIHGYISRSDTLEEGYIRYSSDNGRSWSPPRAWPAGCAADCFVGRFTFSFIPLCKELLLFAESAPFRLAGALSDAVKRSALCIGCA